MPVFDDSGIRFEYSLTSEIAGEQPQPSFDGDAVELRAPKSKFRATVKATALAGGGPALVNNVWHAGFIQEISATCRVGAYDPDVRLEDRIWGVPTQLGRDGRRIRDSMGGELPYDGNSKPLVHATNVEIKSSDDPNLELPLEVVLPSGPCTLRAVSGGDRFFIWLAVTRDEPVKRLVILARIEWQVNWRAVVNAAARTAFIPLERVVTQEPPVFNIARGFGAADPRSNEYPQDLTSVEGNDFFYRVIFRRNIEVHRGEVDSDPSEPAQPLGRFDDLMAGAERWM